MKLKRLFCMTLLACGLSAANMWAQEPATDEEGFYLLASAADVEAFAAKVNAGESTLKARLVADIDYEGMENAHTPIGNTLTLRFDGEFDGQGHRIRNLHMNTAGYVGFFGVVGGPNGAIIRNVIIDSSCSFSSTSSHVGALVGITQYAGDADEGLIQIIGCVNEAEVSGENGVVAGLVGAGQGRAPYCRIAFINCANKGNVSTTMKRAAAFMVNAGRRCSLTNCYNTGTITGVKTNNTGTANNLLEPANAYNEFFVTNCYDLSATETRAQGTLLDPEYEGGMLQSGELCYRLNGNQEEISWWQKLDEDSEPLPYYKEGAQVYANGALRCDGAVLPGEVEYSNTKVSIIPDHVYDHGVCTACGLLDATYKEPVDGVYELEDGGDLYWFATLVNSSSEYYGANARLTADINYWGFDRQIGTIRYEGTFDGQGHHVAVNIIGTQTEGSAALFCRNYGTIKNLFMEGTATIESYRAASVAAFNWGEVANCVSTMNFSSNLAGTNAAGGIVGICYEGARVRNCVFAGSISGTEALNCGGIVGYLYGHTEITNCLMAGELNIVLDQNSNAIARASGTAGDLKNCYCLEGFEGTTDANTVALSREQVEGGEATWRLNGETFLDAAFEQKLGEDRFPLPWQRNAIVFPTNEGYESVNPEDADSHIMLRDYVTEQETQFVEETIAWQMLLDEYMEEINTWQESETFQEFCDSYRYVLSLKQSIYLSIQAYQNYMAACDYATNYLAENAFHGPKRTLLETYLGTKAKPSELFANGTYLYILDTHLLSDEEITAEAQYVNDLLAEAVSENVVAGTEITTLIPNVGFEEDFEGWNVKFEGGNVSVGGARDIMSVGGGWNNKWFDVNQTVTDLPNGIYMIRMNAAYRPFGNNSSTFHAGQVYLNGNANYVMNEIEDALPKENALDGENCHITGDSPDYTVLNEEDAECYVPNTTLGCSYAFRADRYLNYTAVEVTDSTLTFGVRNLGTNLANDWMGFGGIRIFYLGTADEASTALDKVLDSYEQRAQKILEFPWDLGTNYSRFPNVSTELLQQIDATISARQKVATGEEKMQLIDTFSRLFGEVYECRMAYIDMVRAADALINMAYILLDDELLDRDDYDKAEILFNEAWDAYVDGTMTAEQAKQETERIKACDFGLPAVDGVYQIGSPYQLAVFATKVEGGEYAANAVLTDDIDFSEYNKQIGVPKYTGTFDGQRHTITINLTGTNVDGSAALFYRNEGHILNLHVTGTANTTTKFAAGLVAFNTGSVESCISTVTLNSELEGANGMGGLVGWAYSGTQINHSVYAGIMIGEASTNCGGIVGYINGPTTITNCLMCGKMNITMNTNSSAIGRNSATHGTLNNNYYPEGFEGLVDNNASPVLTDQLESGEVAYLLSMGQKLGEDAYPSPLSEMTVYLLPDGTYSNNPDAIRTPIANSQQPTAIYDLTGRKVQKATKGLYIINGKKALVK